MIKRIYLLSCAVAVLCLSSCHAPLKTAVVYQSVRIENPKHVDGIKQAEIILSYSISPNGELYVEVGNPTDNIMVIDQTRSFFVNSNGTSICYYDPTVRTSTKTDMSSETGGVSLSLGAVAGALGIGGTVGQLLSGVGLSGAKSGGTATSNTTYFADQPQIALGPRGSGMMSKAFKIEKVGKDLPLNSPTFTTSNRNQSPTTFSVCISYSFDNGETYKTLTTNLFVNSQYIKPTSSENPLNYSLREIYREQPTAIYEPWWMVHVNNNVNTLENPNKSKKGGLSIHKTFDVYTNNRGIIDFQ